MGVKAGRASLSCRVRGFLAETKGQATVEFAIALPVLIIVAAIAVNALLFFSDCAAFDRMFRNAVRIHAASPAYGQDSAQSCALIEQTLASAFARDGLEVEVSSRGGGAGHTTFTATLFFAPTLFGSAPVTEVFGVAMPRLSHVSSMTIDQYKPGVIA